jgi:hypothetical protein
MSEKNKWFGEKNRMVMHLLITVDVNHHIGNFLDV